MRFPKIILGSFAVAGLCSLAQARVIDSSAAYTNPSTVPVMIKIPTTQGTDISGYYKLPDSVDLSKYFKEFTTPGPVLTFSVNTPASYSTTLNSFRVQLWWVNPTPRSPSSTDGNRTQDTTDNRIIGQNLDLLEPYSIPELIVDSIGHPDGDKPVTKGKIFWRSVGDTAGSPRVNMLGPYTVATDGTAHLKIGTSTLGQPNYTIETTEKGNVGFYNGGDGYSLFFNLTDNTDYVATGYVATFGKVFDDDMQVLQMASGSSDHKFSTVRSMNADFTDIPLWNTYTDDNYAAFKQPTLSDYIQVTNVTMSDPSGSNPTHGLKFIEEFPMTSTSDHEQSTDTSSTVTDPNADIKKYFNVSITEDGIFHFKLRDDIQFSRALVGSYFFYYRVYVNDGTNTGRYGTDYFSSFILVYIYNPFTIYTGDAGFSSSVDYSTAKDGSYYWDWYSSSAYGWFLVRDFPNNRWIYSSGHGWIYETGDKLNSDGGSYWYNADSAWGTGNPSNDDEVGWLWTNAANYPFMYSYKDGGWVYYVKDTYTKDSDTTDTTDTSDTTDTTTPTYYARGLGNRLFWSYRQKAYITPNGKDTTWNKNTTIKVNGRKFGTGL